MNKLKKLMSKSAMAVAAATLLATVSSYATGSASQSPCPSGSNCCWWPNGEIATAVAPPTVCCVKCGGAAGQAGYQGINVNGQMQYCTAISYNPGSYPIWQPGSFLRSGKWITSPCS